MRIVEELVEIWLNEVCDTLVLFSLGKTPLYLSLLLLPLEYDLTETQKGQV